MLLGTNQLGPGEIGCAATFATKELATEARDSHNLDPRRTKVQRRKAVHRCTDAGRATVAANRAARRAEWSMV